MHCHRMADWTFEQAQEDLAVGESHLRALIRDNRIPHYRVGKLVRFQPDVLRAWKAAGGTRRDNQEARPNTRTSPARAEWSGPRLMDI